MPPLHADSDQQQHQFEAAQRRLESQRAAEEADQALLQSLAEAEARYRNPQGDYRIRVITTEEKYLVGERRRQLLNNNFSSDYARAAELEVEVFETSTENYKRQLERRGPQRLIPKESDSLEWKKQKVQFLKVFELLNHPVTVKRKRRLLLDGDLRDINDFFKQLLQACVALDELEKLEAESENQNEQLNENIDNYDSDIEAIEERLALPFVNSHEDYEAVRYFQEQHANLLQQLRPSYRLRLDLRTLDIALLRTHTPTRFLLDQICSEPAKSEVKNKPEKKNFLARFLNISAPCVWFTVTCFILNTFGK